MKYLKPILAALIVSQAVAWTASASESKRSESKRGGTSHREKGNRKLPLTFGEGKNAVTFDVFQHPAVEEVSESLPFSYDLISIVAGYGIDPIFIPVGNSGLQCNIEMLDQGACAEEIAKASEDELEGYFASIIRALARTETTDALEFRQHYIATIAVMRQLLLQTEFSSKKALELAAPWVHWDKFDLRTAGLIKAWPKEGGESKARDFDQVVAIHYLYGFYIGNAIERLNKMIAKLKFDVRLPHPQHSPEAHALARANNEMLLDEGLAFPVESLGHSQSQLYGSYVAALKAIHVRAVKGLPRTYSWGSMGPGFSLNVWSEEVSKAARLAAMRFLVTSAASQWQQLYSVVRADVDRRMPSLPGGSEKRAFDFELRPEYPLPLVPLQTYDAYRARVKAASASQPQ